MDTETRREKQKALLVRMAERKVRSRAQQIYESRGQAQGQDLENWYQAESEVLENNMIAMLYKRVRTSSQESSDSSMDAVNEQASVCETAV